SLRQVENMNRPRHPCVYQADELEVAGNREMYCIVWPPTAGPEVTHAELSKLDPSGVVPGHPTKTPNTAPYRGGRIWPGFKKVTVWSSWVGNIQRMLSPA